LFPVTALTEPSEILLEGRPLPFLLKRSMRRRTLALSVDEHGLAVHAPWRASRRHIERFVIESSNWVQRKLVEWSRFKPRMQRWIAGAEMPYLGLPLRLQLREAARTQAAVEPARSELRIALPLPHSEPQVRQAAVALYRRLALEHFAARIDRYGAILNLKPARLLISNARASWGSCQHNGEVRLNWRLLQTPQHVIDYVVVHELVHLKHMNHSRRFWRLVEQTFPQHRLARDYLDEKGRWYLDL
jgi:predicted metal-dependent hydrolase